VRRADSYKRRGPQREPYDYVLIVCEGGKTEPNYFRRLRDVYRLNSANIEITRADGTDPVSVVKFTEARLIQGEFDRAYCVFDRDGHANYSEALQIVANSQNGKNGRLRAITSVPCFEIWVLLHFRYSSAAFNSAGSQSACDRVVAEVRKHFADYSKGHTGVYDRLETLMEKAHAHAKRLTEENATTGSTNPATRVHELVEYLCNIRK
jgi:hypothetical protein